MPGLIGIDEAGLGPNLGPFISAGVRWDIPLLPEACSVVDRWAAAQSDVISDDPKGRDGRVIIADSKAVFAPGKGLAPLERSALALLVSAGQTRLAFDETGMLGPVARGERWCWDVRRSAADTGGPDSPLPLASRDQFADSPPTVTAVPWEQPWSQRTFPVAAEPRAIADAVSRLQSLAARGSQFEQATATVWSPRVFNRGLEAWGDNKATVTAAAHGLTLRRLLPDPAVGTGLVIADKHGGRNFYRPWLLEQYPGAWIDTLEEGSQRSRYRIGGWELLFRPRAEAFAVVAMASLIAKYIREVQMLDFNAFWQRQRSGLKPTQGYPVDAARFAAETAPDRVRLGIANADFWRRK